VIIRLQPHFQIDQIDAMLKLVTTVHRSEQR
jgi:predicted component of type VI protein secretion system